MKYKVLLSFFLIAALGAGVYMITMVKPKKESLTISMTTEFFDADPIKARGYQQFQILGLTLGTLVKINEDGQYIGDIAEKWTVSQDQTQYTFQIAPKASFEDGTPVKASDVVFSFQRHLENDSPSIIRPYLVHILKADNGVIAIDDKTVQFNLVNPYLPFLKIISFQGFGILQLDPSGRIKSSGRYKFIQSNRQNACVIRRQDHFRFAEDTVPKFCFLVERDSQKTIEAVKNGSVDIAMGAPIEAALELANSYQVSQPSHGLVVTNVIMNQNNTFLQSQTHRASIWRLLNYIKTQPGILTRFDVPSSTLLPDGIMLPSYYQRNEPVLSPSEIRKLGISQKTLRLIFPKGIYSETSVNQIIEYFKSAGFEVIPSIVKGKDFLEPIVSGAYDLLWLPYQGLLPDPDGFLEFFTPDSLIKAAKVPNQDISEALTRHRFETSKEDRLKKIETALRVFENQLFIIPFSQNAIPVIFNKTVQIPDMGYRFHFELERIRQTP